MPLSRFVLALTKIIHPVAGPNEDTEYGDAANPDVRVEDILPGRKFPMTPEKYLRQAALFHKSSNPKVRRLAQDHENLARVNEVAVYVRRACSRSQVATIRWLTRCPASWPKRDHGKTQL